MHKTAFEIATGETLDIPGCELTHLKYLYRITESNLKLEFKDYDVKKRP